MLERARKIPAPKARGSLAEDKQRTRVRTEDLSSGCVEHGLKSVRAREKKRASVFSFFSGVSSGQILEQARRSTLKVSSKVFEKELGVVLNRSKREETLDT